MREYRVKAENIGGKNGRIYYKNQIVSEDLLHEAQIEPFLFAGFLEQISGFENVESLLGDLLNKKNRVINITSYRLWLGGGERLGFNLVENTKHPAGYFYHEGSFNYTDSSKFTSFKSHFEMAQLIRCCKDDIIICHDPGVMGEQALHECSNVIWYIHGAHVFEMDVSHMKKPVVCISNYLPSKTHSSWENIKIQAIKLGVDTKQFKPAASTLEEEDLIVGIVGRVSPEKIPDEWFEALEKFNNQKRKIQFHIYGKGDTGSVYFKQFAEKISKHKNVHYHGEISKDKVQSAYQRIDLLMVPSRTETGSFAIVEAQCCGLPVYALNRDGIPNHVVASSLVFDSYEEMFKQLEKTKINRSFKARQNQSKAACKLHSIEKWISQVDDVIDNILKKSQNQITIYTSFTEGYDAERSDVKFIQPAGSFSNTAKNAGYVKWMYWKHGIETEFNMWVDGNIFPLEKAVEYLDLISDADICLFKHPWRDCIYDEANETLKLNFDLASIARPQINRYKNEGYPAHNGLGETGVLIRKDSEMMRNFCAALWMEIEAGSHRDQLAFNYVLSKFPDLKVKYLEPSVRSHQKFKIVPHNKHMAVHEGTLKTI